MNPSTSKSERERVYSGLVYINVDGQWIPKARYVYCQTHPEYTWKKGDCFIFLDGDKRNFSPENVMKCTRKEMLIFQTLNKGVHDTATGAVAFRQAQLRVAVLEAAERRGYVKRVNRTLQVCTANEDLQKVFDSVKRYRQEHKDEIAERMRRYYEEHKDEISEQGRRYRQEHKEDARRYYEEHKDEIAEQGRRYRQEHKEDARRYYEEHKDEIAEQGRRYRQEHKEDARRYYEEHKDEIAERMRRYRQEHKDEINARRRMQYALQKSKQGFLKF